MKTKTFKGSENKLDQIVEFRKHFGWEVEDCKDGVLTMSLDTSKDNAPALHSLEKQAEIIKKSFPFNAIVWASLALLFGVLIILSNVGVFNNLFDGMFSGSLSWLSSLFTNILPILAICLCGLNIFFTLYIVIVFFAVKLSSHRTLEELYRIADVLSGNIIDAPLACNIEPDGPLTGMIARIAHKIGNRG